MGISTSREVFAEVVPSFVRPVALEVRKTTEASTGDLHPNFGFCSESTVRAVESRVSGSLHKTGASQEALLQRRVDTWVREVRPGRSIRTLIRAAAWLVECIERQVLEAVRGDVVSRTSAAAAFAMDPEETGSVDAPNAEHAESLFAVENPETPRGSVPLSELSDQELLEGIRAESELHFGELYNRYFQRIYNFVFARMRNHAETEEVVQETFLAVFRSFENYRGQSSLLSWIYGIAKNTTNNHLRRAKSQNERIDLADNEDLMPRGSIGEGMPDEQLDLHRFGELLSERLDGLADWQAEIFEMRHLQNLSIPEISERTQRSSDAVRSSLYRVKRLFFEAATANGNLPAAAGGNRR